MVGVERGRREVRERSGLGVSVEDEEEIGWKSEVEYRRGCGGGWRNERKRVRRKNGEVKKRRGNRKMKEYVFLLVSPFFLSC